MRASVLALCLGLAAAPAAPSPYLFLTSARGVTLHPDDLVIVRWGGNPAGVEELELLLSLDGGRNYPIRLTEELDPDAGSWTWRVPAGIPAPAARLAIRMRLDEREVPGAESEVFAIAAPPIRTLSWSWSLQARDGDLWLVDNDPAGVPPVTPSGLRLPLPGWSADAPAEEVNLPESRPPAVADPSAVGEAATVARSLSTSSASRRGGRSRRPLDVPLRT